MEVDNFVSQWTSVYSEISHYEKYVPHAWRRQTLYACHCLQYETNMQCSSLVPQKGGGGGVWE